MEWFAHRQDFQSQVRVKTHRSSIVELEWGSFCQHKTNRTAGHPTGVADWCLYVCVGKTFRD